MGTGMAEKILMNYSGSTALSFLCDLTNLSIDQVNFITCQIFALCFSLSMKRWIRDPQTKLIYTLICGLGICLFCFGNQIFHIITSAGVGYLLISMNRTPSMPWYVLSASMFYLSCLHLQKQFFDELGSYTLDITGPLMVLTQKVTSLAFSLQDAVDHKKNDDDKESSTEMQRKYAVDTHPTFLEYWSFIFQFQSMLAGPLVLFKDFREFIHTDEFPSPLVTVVKKLCVSVFFAVVFIKVTPVYSIDHLKESDFLWDTTFLYRMFYVTIATMMERAKYYHAWILADAVCNASGLGYVAKSQTWDLVTNVDALEFELGLNLKESLDCWNKGTMKWLRYVVYERVSPKVRTVATYAMSAIWHGFYPGYYMTFLSGALFTSAARQIRKTVRPFFLNNKFSKFAYDFSTWLTTRFVIAYVTFSFVILDFTPTIILFFRLFFCFHFAAFGAMFALPRISKHWKLGGKTMKTNNEAVKKSTAQQQDKNNLLTSSTASNNDERVSTPTAKILHTAVEQDELDYSTTIDNNKTLSSSFEDTQQSLRVIEQQSRVSPQLIITRKDHDTTSTIPCPPQNHRQAAKDINILSQHEFPEISSYLRDGEHAKSWSSWTNHTNTPVQLKTG